MSQFISNNFTVITVAMCIAIILILVNLATVGKAIVNVADDVVYGSDDIVTMNGEKVQRDKDGNLVVVSNKKAPIPESNTASARLITPSQGSHIGTVTVTPAPASEPSHVYKGAYVDLSTDAKK